MHVYQTLLIALGTGLLLTGHASAEPLKKEDLEKMMTSLENIRKAVLSRNSKQNGVALRAYQNHASSPVSANQFYLECLKKLRFTDEGKKAEAWRTYRESQDDTFNSVYHRQAKQLELAYLILTIKAGQETDRREMMAPLISFADQLVAADGRAYRYIDSISGSLFVEAYGIDSSIDPGNWASDPTSIESIYDQAILPHMRDHRDPRLVTAWKSKISQVQKFEESRKMGKERQDRESAREDRRNNRGGGANSRDPRLRAEANEERDPYEDFLNDRLPKMKWDMCEDLVKHGFRDEALGLMFEVIKAHPEYPEIHNWLNGLENELKTAATELGGGSTTTAP